MRFSTAALRPHPKPRSHPRVAVALSLLIAGLLLVADLVTPPPVGAQNPVDEARAAAEAATERFVSAQAEAQAIETEIAAIEQRLADAQADAETARADAERRAVSLYMGRGTDFVTVIDTSRPLEAARRAELVGHANEEAAQSFERLGVISDDLERRRAELESARAAQASLLESLAADQAQLDSELARVQAAWEAEQTRQSAAESTTSSSASPQPASDVTDDEPGATPVETSPAAPATEARDTAAPTTPATEAPTTTEAPPPTPAPKPAPPSSGGVHPHHSDPFLVCTRTRESSGNYQAENQNGLYFGAYQFHQSTWNGTASYAGRPELIGVVPSHASEYDQDDMAWTLYQWQGKTPWLGLC